MNRGVCRPTNRLSPATRPKEAAASAHAHLAQKESIVDRLINTVLAVALGTLIGTALSVPFLFPAVLR